MQVEVIDRLSAHVDGTPSTHSLSQLFHSWSVHSVGLPLLSLCLHSLAHTVAVHRCHHRDCELVGDALTHSEVP